MPADHLVAEKALLGRLLMSPEAFELVQDQLTAEDFSDGRLRRIFQVMADRVAAGKGFDAALIATQVDKKLLAELEARPASEATLIDQAAIIREAASRRDARFILSELFQQLDDPGVEMGRFIHQAENGFKRIATRNLKGADTSVQAADIVDGVLANIRARAGSSNGITGLATGFNDFDELTAGLQGGDLIVLAARPSMGKTTFAFNLAEASLKAGQAALVFSLEMPKEQLIERMTASLGSIELERIRKGQINTELLLAKLRRTIEQIRQMQLFIDDDANITVEEICRRARALARKQKLAIIIVDYLQLVRYDPRLNKADAIGEISRTLKSLAKELGVPIVALSQLNRSLEQRPDKRPILSDLRDSGAIEQDADIIIFIYRDEFYHEDSKDKGLAEIIVAKQRQGERGTVKLAFQGQYVRFRNPPEPDLEEEDVEVTSELL